MVNTDLANLGELIGKNSSEIKVIKEEGFGTQQYGFNQITPIDNIKIPNDTIIVSHQLIGSAFILSHSVNGRLGNTNYTLGIGSYGSYTRAFIGNYNNTFVEDFGISTFIDSANTTASISTSLFECDFGTTGTKQLQTSTIYYDPSNDVKKVTLFLSGTNTSTGSYYVSGNGGSSWTSCTPGISASLTVGSDVRIKVLNYVSSGNNFPTAWNSWGVAETTTQLKLTKLKCYYEV